MKQNPSKKSLEGELPITRKEANRRAKEIVKRYADCRSLAEELIAERKEEASS